MTNRPTFVVVAVIAAALVGCGTVEVAGLAAGDGGADLGGADLAAGDLDAPASDGPTAENPPSDAGAGEVLPDVGPDALPPATPACAPLGSQGQECRPRCFRCLGPDFAYLARSGAPCAAPGDLLCVYACGDCP